MTVWWRTSSMPCLRSVSLTLLLLAGCATSPGTVYPPAAVEPLEEARGDVAAAAIPAPDDILSLPAEPSRTLEPIPVEDLPQPPLLPEWERTPKALGLAVFTVPDPEPPPLITRPPRVVEDPRLVMRSDPREPDNSQGAGGTGEPPAPPVSRFPAAAPPPAADSETGRSASPLPAAVPDSSAPAWAVTETQESRTFTISSTEPRLVTLPGLGWTLRGGEGAYRLIERYMEDGSTVFTFLFSEPGGGVLNFQRQELARRLLNRRKLVFTLIEKEPPLSSAGAAAAELAGETAAPRGDLPSWDFYARALGSGALDPFREPFWREFLAAGAGEPEALLEAAQVLWRNAEWDALEPLLSALEGRDLPLWRQDELLFLQGRLHDVGSPWRDEKASLGYYRRLTENFPASLYWEEADQRARYIERHFFQIR